jgi:hypothetical protein
MAQREGKAKIEQMCKNSYSSIWRGIKKVGKLIKFRFLQQKNRWANINSYIEANKNCEIWYTHRGGYTAGRFVT